MKEEHNALYLKYNLQFKKYFNISHLIPTLILPLVHFMDLEVISQLHRKA